MPESTHHDYPHRRLGFALGVAAVLCWAVAGAAASWLGKHLGVWPTMALAGGIGGAAQLVFYLFMGFSVKRVLLPPLKLWGIVFLGFTLYEFAHIAALAGSASDAQTVGVNLINYLWPTLTVVFAVMWVPKTKATWRLALAAALALAGVAAGNWKGVQAALSPADPGASALPVYPYVLMLVAAAAWSIYSALLSRWRAWAGQYSTATAGFLSLAVIAAVVAAVRGDWRPLTGAEWGVAVFAGLVVYAAGYMLWELAIHRAPAEKLGLLGAAVPVLSTLCLYAMFALVHTGKPASASDLLRQFLAAGLIAAAVVVSMLRRKRDKTVPPAHD